MRLFRFPFALALAAGLAAPSAAQSIATDRQRGLQMLDQIREDVVQHFHDPTFGGVDFDGLVDSARQRVNAAQSLGEIFGILAGVCLDLRDSHTMFIPPERVQSVDYGWSWRYVGDQALVDWVDEASDAYKQGLRRGDTVIEVAGYTLARPTHRVVSNLLRNLRPQPKLTLTVARNGVRRTLTAASRIKTLRRKLDLDNALDLYVLYMQQAIAGADAPETTIREIGDGVVYWRFVDFSTFAFIKHYYAPKIRKAKHVILDLRGNPGGRIAVLLSVAGLFAPPGTPVIATAQRTQQMKYVVPDDARPYAGPVSVLVDSRSGSCAEMLARFLQSRGARVYGDRTAGAVSEATTFWHSAGHGDGDYKVVYGVRVTIGAVSSPDGTRLEGAGIAPDVLVLPTADDLDRRLDPVLAQAATAAGVTLDPRRADRLSR